MTPDAVVPDAVAAGRSPAFWLAVVVVLLGSYLIRMRGAEQLYRDGAVLAFNDLDSQRRLARLDALAQAESYPVVELRDGFPAGTISHWTLPFDWFLQALNPLVASFAGPSVGYEAAAVYAGPVLCLLCVALFLWAAVRWLGRGPGLLAAACYSLQVPVVNMFVVGNGDHQNLQHLFLLVFALCWLLRAAGCLGAWSALVSGAGLGLGLWVSTESMMLLLSWIAVTGLLAVLPAGLSQRWGLDRAEHLSDERRRCVGLLLALLLGMYCEQLSLFAFEWDRISWFQIYPVTVFALFVFACGRLRPLVAAVGALSLGLAGLFGVPGFAEAFATQLESFALANVWLQEAVSEFRPSFVGAGGWSFMVGIRRFTWLLLALPLCLLALALASTVRPRARVVMVGGTLATFAMAVYEVKLSHLFSVWFPLALVAGAAAMRQRWPRLAAPAASWSLVVLLLGVAVYRLPSGELNPQVRNSDDAVRDLCRWLAERDGKTEGSVMAPWELGAQIMYRGGWPVVASGYHRNIAGIHDAYRYFMAQPGDAAVVQEILQRRRVRYVVAWFDRYFLRTGQVVLGGERVYVDARGGFTRLARDSLFSRLRYSVSVPGYRVVYQSPMRIQLGAGAPETPIFRVFEVVH